MEYNTLSLLEHIDLLKQGKVTSEELTKYYISKCKEMEKYNAVLEIFDDAIDNAKAMDEKIKGGFDGALAGVPVIIKDNILYKGKKCTCSSKFLENYVAQYSATVVEKLLDAGAIIIGRANMDEFAMGSSTENSAFGVTHNAINFDCVAGGSSGGSAVAVAGGMCPLSLGTDTGGSVRQPCAINGIVGIKPTYGRVSRYGVIAFASSLEQVGPMTKTVKDNAYALQVLAGASEHDETSSKREVPSYIEKIDAPISGLKVCVLKEVEEAVKGLETEASYRKTKEILSSLGVEIVEKSMPDFSLSLACYYVIAPAEATSNLGRFDGIKYSRRSEDAKNVDEIYTKSRTEGFGEEVKRRIMLGNFVLSSGYFDAYYNKAKAVQQKLKDEAGKILADCDAILLPTTAGKAFKIGEKTDPVSMYKEDLFTIIANILGVPALTLPCGETEDKMPLGVQILGREFDEATVYQIANAIEMQRRKA